ncbi:MAG: hypothetical protein WC732_05970 [Candidatus Omnitrophota bacterium]
MTIIPLVSALAPLAALFANAVFHVFFSRVGKLRRNALPLGAFLGLVILACLDLGAGGNPERILTDGAIYVLFSYCYYHFNNLGETARRVRILRELSNAPIGLTSAELLACYNAGEVLDRRLRRLEESGQLARKGAVYVVAGGAFLPAIAGAMHFLKRLLFRRTGRRT